METKRYGFICQLVVVLSGILLIEADIYLHNPSGSNNRLAESSVARNNANRLFDSQNNEKGGYNSRRLYYYTGSKLMIEWTNQHSCQHPNNNCELVLQYMCHDLIRDGTSVKTIPTNTGKCKGGDCDRDFQYGMHENYTYYQTCAQRERNKGLFFADQKLKKDTAIYTRQNPDGTRRGYECPEERDYYPYWHPSPWIDIAVMTNNVSWCSYYTQNSQNVKSKWSCNVTQPKNIVIPNNKEECETNGKIGVWTEYPAHAVAAPICREAQFSWDNYLGNGLNGKSNVFNWTIPETPGEHCVLRIRYNISTTDYDWWADHTLNPDKKGEPSKVNLSKEYPLNGKAKERGYVFKQNPVVKIFEDVDFDLRLAINTAQFGRVFQDRSHTFSIKKRPQDLKDAVIHNLNVRGKRGNIVQVYPAVEYDFVPNLLNIATGDYIHFQWNGSNTNNKNFEGNGIAGTDRNNVVMLAESDFSEKSKNVPYKLLSFGHYGTNYPTKITNSSFLELSKDDITKLAHLGNTKGNDPLLNKADTYFDLGPRKITKQGKYHYMCTRNNDFSNRDQKGKIVVRDFPIVYKMIGLQGGTIAIQSKAALYIPPNTLDKLLSLQMASWRSDEGNDWLKEKRKRLPIVEGFASDFILLLPVENFAAEGPVRLSINLTDTDSDIISVYRTGDKEYGVWQRIVTEIENGVAHSDIKQGGVYIAVKEKSLDMITNVIIIVIMFTIGLIAVLVYFYYKKSHPWLYAKNA
ncbi:protein DD3-3 [Octopus sinensis]|uniref:Protein DD3-3 n=1 Tax=Octopus sinensis TaxID=2607531 RepID=A0A6P7SX69_9MOLL|nr:protein DD3-3 [Octopus sinensis]